MKIKDILNIKDTGKRTSYGEAVLEFSSMEFPRTTDFSDLLIMEEKVVGVKLSQLVEAWYCNDHKYAGDGARSAAAFRHAMLIMGF